MVCCYFHFQYKLHIRLQIYGPIFFTLIWFQVDVYFPVLCYRYFMLRFTVRIDLILDFTLYTDRYSATHHSRFTAGVGFRSDYIIYRLVLVHYCDSLYIIYISIWCGTIWCCAIAYISDMRFGDVPPCKVQIDQAGDIVRDQTATTETGDYSDSDSDSDGTDSRFQASQTQRQRSETRGTISWSARRCATVDRMILISEASYWFRCWSEFEWHTST